MAFKSITILSHNLKKAEQTKTASGDLYDSSLLVMSESGAVIDDFKRVNVDATLKMGYPLEIANQKYGGIVGLHKGNYPAILIFDFQYFDRIKSWKDFWSFNSPRKVPGRFPNPKHDNRPELWFVNIHKGGDNWDWSEGCITIHYSEYERLMSHFKENEKIVILKEGIKEV